MKDKTNIYVTLHEPVLVNERIIGFLENFIFTIKRIVKSEYSIFIKGRDFNNLNYIEFVKKSDIFVFILDKEYDTHLDYQKELSEISTSLSIDKDNLPEYQTFYKVCLDTFNEKLLPDCILSSISYMFYEINLKKKTSVPFDIQKDSVMYWAKMLDLVYDINESILHLIKPELSKSSNFVFLGTCSPDQVTNRDDIKRELQHMGYRVLPLTELPSDTELFKTEVKKNLEKCRYIFQLVGQYYGTIKPGDKQSLLDIEHQIIRDSLNSDVNKRRMIWVPINLKFIEHKQELFVNKLRRDDPGLNTEIIESGLNEFKTSIFLRLGSKVSYPETIPVSDQSIYIISKPEIDVAEIEKIILDNNIQVLKLSADKTQNLYKQHLEYLTKSNGLIIYYPSNDENWLISKIRDIIKSLGQSRNEPFKGICLISDNTPDLENYNPWMPEMTRCKIDDIQGVIQFINSIKG